MRIDKQLIVNDDYMGRYTEVVRKVKKTGFHVNQELKEIGVISGFIDSAKLPELSKIKGIAFEESSRDVRIAPPGSEIQ